MRSTASLPSSNFRLAAMVALAAVTVGVTVIDIDVADSAATQTTVAPASSVAPTTTLENTAQPETAPANSEAFVASDNANGTPTTIAESAAAAPATSAPAAPATADSPTGASYTNDFEVDALGWASMTGSWTLADGKYVQADATGYDFISQYGALPPTEFSMSVEMTAIGGDFGGGIVVGQPLLGSRRSATLIDFTNSGMFLRWGLYNPDTGAHEYQGGLAMPDGFDPTLPHTLTVEARAARTMVIVDGDRIADFPAVAPGYVGLATSVASIAFDNVEIASL